jgi:hypothetical protein
VTGIAFNSPITSDALDYLIDTQPRVHSFSVTWTPACLNQGTFTVSPNNLAFIAITTTSMTTFTITIQNAVLSNRGTYSLTVTAAVDGISKTHGFTQEIYDSCDRTLFETSPSPIFDMNVILASSVVQTQNYKIWTAIERLHPVYVCPYTATISPIETFITANTTVISVDEQILTNNLPSS